jgi:hypothetical protein
LSDAHAKESWIRGVEKGDSLKLVAYIARLFGVACAGYHMISAEKLTVYLIN